MNVILVILLILAVIFILIQAWEIHQLKKERSYYLQDDQLKDDLKEK